MTRAPILFAVAAACAVACSSAPPSRAPGASIAFDLSATISAHQERYVCELVQMPSDPAGIFVGTWANTASAGVHHYLLFRTSFPPGAPPPNLGQPVDCFEGDGMMQYERGYVAGGQTRQDSGGFGQERALAFASGEVLLLQAHLLDAGSADLAASVHVELGTMDASDVSARVGTFRFYDPYIYVAPHASATARMRCPIARDVTLISAGSHMHARGVNYRAWLDDAGEAPSATPFYATTDWQSPPFWIGPRDVKAGSAIRFACDYENATDATFVQGLRADADEMCMFSAFYVPAADGDDPDDECARMDSLGTGDRTCAQTTSCLELCAPSDEPHFASGDPRVGACWQKCIADSCPSASAALLPQLECTQAQCATECASFGATCSQCVEAKCKAQLDACQAAACGG